jgi:ATP-dependent RNA helicase RhlE
MTFATLGLSEPILKAVANEGYTVPTPIQAQAIPHVLAGSDLLGVAQTGTGKTAAFALPIIDRLLSAGSRQKSYGRFCRVLVLSPTRELASQIADSFATYGRHARLAQAVIYGGVSQGPQERAVRKGLDIVIATPGRLLDLMNQRIIDLRSINMFVLDEADRMLDMGFMPDIRRIVSRLPAERQTLFFSATMPKEIRELADTLLSDPVTVKIAATSAAADTVEQSIYFVDQRNKPRLLTHVLSQLAVSRAIVFTRTRHSADRVTRQLEKSGIRAEAIHGDKSQAARQRALASFKSASPPVLVATDVAARGLDIDNVSHVFNYDLPNVAETYVHRIGRTGRAGATGMAVSFCSGDQRGDLKAIERFIGQRIRIENDHPVYPSAQPHGDSGAPPTGSTPGDDSARPPRQRRTDKGARVPFRGAQSGPSRGSRPGAGPAKRKKFSKKGKRRYFASK